MSVLKNWIIVMTFFFLWLSTMFGEFVQNVLASILILTFGILHGANDISIMQKISTNHGFKLNYYKTLAIYVAVVLSILGLFFLYAPLALILFIVLSAYHFGEQHFENKVSEVDLVAKALYFFYGATILFMIFLSNMNKVNQLFNYLADFNPSENSFKFFLTFTSIGFVSCAVWLYLKNKLTINLVREIFYLLLLMLVFNTAGLLWGFCIYFILWHSLPSVVDQIHFLYGGFTKQKFLSYVKSSWKYWAVSILGLVGLYFLFKNDTQFLTVILIYFLAAITFPHVLVMSQLDKT